MRKLFSNPRKLASIIAANVVLCALAFWLIEGGGPLRSLYWAVTTATTTGYGDVSPASAPGMILAMWLQVTSLAAFGLAISLLTEWLIENPNLFSHDEQEEIQDDQDDCIAMLTLLLEHHGIEVPSTVEEYQGKRKKVT
jgi:voltage-gated potassium channel